MFVRDGREDQAWVLVLRHYVSQALVEGVRVRYEEEGDPQGVRLPQEGCGGTRKGKIGEKDREKR
jgi:hypothetical protein